MDKKLINTEPPIWADRFFEWYCNADMQEEILGDLYESFMDKSANGNLFQAKCWYWLQVILFINRRTLSRNTHFFTRLNSIDMFRSYFKIGYRNILKNKGTTFINAFGMALAIGCCLVVFQFVHFMYNMDNFHTKRDEIYVVQRVLAQNGEQVIWNDVPIPLGKALKNDFPQLGDLVRINFNRGVVEYEDKVFSESIAFTDTDYFNLFDFPIKWGNKANFSNPESIVLGIRKAEKYFGSKNPIGKTIDIRFNQQGKEIVERFIVQGVLEKAPESATFSPGILIPFERQKAILEKMEDWTTTSSITFLQAKNQGDIATIKANQKPYLATMNAANENWNMVDIHFQPLKNLLFNNNNVRNRQFGFTEKAAIYGLISIATCMLLLVCFNYINISLASASTRLKEIGVRKVMGSSRQQIIWQFIVENVLICFLSLGIGIFLAYTFFFPWFNNMLNGELNLSLSFIDSPALCLFVLALTIITAIGGAGYPAFYISKFHPNAIIKKEFKVGTQNGFRKALISMQLILTIITIFTTYVFLLDTHQQKQKDWGYHQHDLTVIPLKNGNDFEKFRTDILNNPNVMAVAGSKEYLGTELLPLKVDVAGESYNLHGMQIDDNYLPTLGIELLDGRNFDKKLEADPEQSVIVNAAFRKRMNWTQAEGQNLKIGSKNYTVIGEVADFHSQDFFYKVKPLVLQMATTEQLKYVSIRSQPGTAKATAKALFSNWKKIYPHAPYNYSFQDGVFFWYFDKYRQTNSILSATAFLTIIIATIGFFGLAMLLLTRKMKELSIRKVLGASFFHISHLINKEFFLPLLIAIGFGLPIAFYVSKSLLNDVFSPFSSIGVLPFLLTIGSICMILGISLAKHIYTANASNPSHFLKDE